MNSCGLRRGEFVSTIKRSTKQPLAAISLVLSRLPGYNSKAVWQRVDGTTDWFSGNRKFESSPPSVGVLIPLRVSVSALSVKV